MQNNQRLETIAKTSKIVNVLQRLGLSKYESRVYVSLVLKGVSKGGVLSISSGVPRTKVYTSLEKLMEKGFVNKLPGRTHLFSPNSPAKSFEGYLSKHKSEASNKIATLVESEDAVLSLEKIYETTRFNIYFQKRDVWIVNSESKILEKMKKMLTHASDSITLVTTIDGFHYFYKNFETLLKKLDKRGIHIQIGIPTQISTKDFKYQLKQITIDMPLLFLEIKDQAFFIVNLRNKNIGIFCTDPTLRNFFSLLLNGFTEQVTKKVLTYQS